MTGFVSGRKFSVSENNFVKSFSQMKLVCLWTDLNLRKKKIEQIFWKPDFAENKKNCTFEIFYEKKKLWFEENMKIKRIILLVPRVLRGDCRQYIFVWIWSSIKDAFSGHEAPRLSKQLFLRIRSSDIEIC